MKLKFKKQAINVQAFNATDKDARLIYEALDDFQSRRSIQVISAN